MPTTAQVINRNRPRRPDRHYTATVTATGTPATVALNPGGAQTKAISVNAVAHPVGTRVLVLVTHEGNYIIGKI